jgi:fatty acid desaturase
MYAFLNIIEPAYRRVEAGVATLDAFYAKQDAVGKGAIVICMAATAVLSTLAFVWLAGILLNKNGLFAAAIIVFAWSFWTLVTNSVTVIMSAMDKAANINKD